MTVALDLSAFIEKHKLPDRYSKVAKTWFVPLAERILSIKKQRHCPIVVGINGSQGSGKSTLADLLQCVLQQLNDISVLPLSIDDFYLTRNEREALAERIHPLLATRGVPGTHDIKLALKTLSALKGNNGAVKIPRFDKSQDDRAPQSQWQTVNTPLDVIILEGWCVGSPAQAENQLTLAVNALEADEDPDKIWRSYANQQLQQNYPALFSQVDIWIMLKAPSFKCVFDWRLQQEEKLKQAVLQQGQVLSSGVMSADEIARFIQHYQRITEHTLNTLPEKMHFLFELDKHREIISLSNPVKLA